jgi:hypothetical protein
MLVDLYGHTCQGPDKERSELTTINSNLYKYDKHPICYVKVIPYLLEHLQPLEAPGPKSGDIFVRIGCKTGVGGSNFPVVTPAFADIVSK